MVSWGAVWYISGHLGVPDGSRRIKKVSRGILNTKNRHFEVLVINLCRCLIIYLSSRLNSPQSWWMGFRSGWMKLFYNHTRVFIMKCAKIAQLLQPDCGITTSRSIQWYRSSVGRDQADGTILALWPLEARMEFVLWMNTSKDKGPQPWYTFLVLLTLRNFIPGA